MERYTLPVEVSELPQGGFMATCPMLKGCHAEGRTAAEAVENMEDVAKIVVEMKSRFAVLAHIHPSPPKARRRCPLL